MITAGVLALGLASYTPSNAQGPLFDRVNVNLPYTVTIGERTLQPGDYVIQQLRDNGGGSRVLLIYSDSGMKFETSAMTIPALQGPSKTPENTQVVLHHFGNDYYFDKVWIQGKDYGYEFPLPDAVKSRNNERAAPLSVAASYSTTQQADTAATAKTTTPAEVTTQAATSAATSQGTTLGQASAAQSAATTPSTATTRSQTMQPATTTQSATAQPSTMQPATTQSATTTRSTMAPATAPSSATSADRTMPATSAGWLMMLMGGGTLSGIGFALRRKL